MKSGDMLFRSPGAFPGFWKRIVEKNHDVAGPYVLMCRSDDDEEPNNVTYVRSAVDTALIVYVHPHRSLRGTTAMYILCDTGELGWTWDTGWTTVVP